MAVRQDTGSAGVAAHREFPGSPAGQSKPECESKQLAKDRYVLTATVGINWQPFDRESNALPLSHTSFTNNNSNHNHNIIYSSNKKSRKKLSNSIITDEYGIN